MNVIGSLIGMKLPDTISLIQKMADLKSAPALLSGCKNVDDVKTVIAGHSHVASYYEGVRGESGAAVLVANPKDESYWRALEKIADDRTIGIVWQGNQHNGRFLFAGEQPFDLVPVADHEAPVVAGRQVVPEEVVREQMQASLTGLPAIATSLKKTRVAVLGTPPPRLSAEELRPMVMREPFYVEYARQLGIDLEKAEFTDLAVRVKLWRVLQQQLKEIADSAGIVFLAVPERAIESDGSLRRDYWANDATHANGKFGHMMFALLAEALH